MSPQEIAEMRRWALPFDEVLERSAPEPNTSCVLWAGRVSKHGYGVFSWRGKPQRAHRWVWMRAHGYLAKGEVVCHRCDTPACVNLNHLFVGTQGDNVRDMRDKGRLRTPFGRGAEHYRSRLSEDDVRRMCARRLDGATFVEIAAEYGVHNTTAMRLVKGERWPHLSR